MLALDQLHVECKSKWMEVHSRKRINQSFAVGFRVGAGRDRVLLLIV